MSASKKSPAKSVAAPQQGYVPPVAAPAAIASAMREAVVSYIYGSPSVVAYSEAFQTYRYDGEDTRHILACGIEPMDTVDPDSVVQQIVDAEPRSYYEDEDQVVPVVDPAFQDRVFMIKDLACNCGKTFLVSRAGSLPDVMEEMLNRTIRDI